MGGDSFRVSDGARALDPDRARPRHASSPIQARKLAVPAVEWPADRGGDPRLALLAPPRVVPRAPKLPSIRQRGPSARGELFGAWRWRRGTLWGGTSNLTRS